ncbi:hypothetical protein BGX28_009610 [Mortierella sp. GBA30]|nr:hypothetical protein BGX28_009610 [Mortierella sp. GBA30]
MPDDVHLTLDQKIQLREQKAKYPTKTHVELALWTQKCFHLARPPSQATISDILHKPIRGIPAKQTPAFPFAKQTRVYLTDEQRRRMYEHKKKHPQLSLHSLGVWAQKQFQLIKSPDPTTVKLAMQAMEYGKNDRTNIYLTSEQKLMLYEHQAQHPSKKLSSLALWAEKRFKLSKTPSDTYISNLLKWNPTTPKLTTSKSNELESGEDSGGDDLHIDAGVSRRQPFYPPILERALLFFVVNRTIYENSMPTHAEITHKGQQLAEEMSLSNDDVGFSYTWIVHFLKRHGIQENSVANCDIKRPLLTKLKIKKLLDEELLHLASAHSSQDQRLGPDPTSGLTELDRALILFIIHCQLRWKTLPSRPEIVRKAGRLRSIMGLSSGRNNNNTFTLSDDWIKRHRVFYGIHSLLVTGQIKNVMAAKLGQDKISDYLLLDFARDSRIGAPIRISKPVPAAKKDFKNSWMFERALVLFTLRLHLLRKPSGSRRLITRKGRQFLALIGQGPNAIDFSRDWFRGFRTYYGLYSGVVDTRLRKGVLTKLGRKAISDLALLDLASEECIDGDVDDEDSDEVDEDGGDDVVGDDLEAGSHISQASESEYEGDHSVSIASDDYDDQGDQVGSDSEKNKSPEPESESEYDGDLVGMSSDGNGKEDKDDHIVASGDAEGMSMDADICGDTEREVQQEVKQEDEQEARQDIDMIFEAQEAGAGGPSTWSLQEKLRALFVVIPLLDPFVPQQKEAYAVLNDLHARFQVPGLKQEPIDATTGDWTREKRHSLSIVMTLLDPSVESHRSTHLVLSEEYDSLCHEK